MTDKEVSKLISQARQVMHQNLKKNKNFVMIAYEIDTAPFLAEIWGQLNKSQRRMVRALITEIKEFVVDEKFAYDMSKSKNEEEEKNGKDQ